MTTLLVIYLSFIINMTLGKPGFYHLTFTANHLNGTTTLSNNIKGLIKIVFIFGFFCGFLVVVRFGCNNLCCGLLVVITCLAVLQWTE